MNKSSETISVQTWGLEQFKHLVELRPHEILEHFKKHRSECELILTSSYDKRFSPSTFVEEYKNRFRVGWFDQDYKECRMFKTLEEAVTDYLLFSLGKGRFQEE